MGEDPTEQEDEDLPDDETQDASGPDSSPDSDAATRESAMERNAESVDGEQTEPDDADGWGGDGPTVDEGSTEPREDGQDVGDEQPGPEDKNEAVEN